MIRSSGILMPVFSLPGPHGIGNIGYSAKQFVDFLSEAGQKYWQILPLSPLDSGNSPYCSISAFAGNYLLIDLEALVQLDLLSQSDLSLIPQLSQDYVDYDSLKNVKLFLLKKAYSRYKENNNSALDEYKYDWLESYGKYIALHEKYNCDFKGWPVDATYDEDEASFYRFVQQVFYSQWMDLKKYANTKGIKIIGDVPFYLSFDSVEVWTDPSIFQLNEDGRPSWVSGVPPDDFSADGQLWGQPLYNWENRSTWEFWLKRMSWASNLFDAVRIDHFRAIHTYWAIPSGSITALDGHWEQGPKQKFIDYLKSNLPDLDFIAEDLGDIDENARKFIDSSTIPGMKVLVFGFEHQGDSLHQPHHCSQSSTIYTSTHDTPTFVEWFNQASDVQRNHAINYLRLKFENGIGWDAISAAWATPSILSIAPMQDILGLGGDSRINLPGSVSKKNWSWRVRSEALNMAVSGKLKYITKLYFR